MDDNGAYTGEITDPDLKTGHRRFTKPWLLYGANGYTGRLVARDAADRGQTPVLAGRTEKSVRPLAEELGFPWRVFDLNDVTTTARKLEGIAAVLNCAGPFSATASPMLEACSHAHAHYLDITGEINVFEMVHTQTKRWEAARIVAMPGVGFDVVPSDCLAAMLKRDLPDATHLKLAFKSRYGKLSPGTTKTMVEGLSEGGKVRRDGKIVTVPPGYKTEKIPFEKEPESAVTIPWGDVSTAYYSTGIPNIEVFMGASPRRIKAMKMPAPLRLAMGLGPVQWFVKRQVGKKVKGPTDEERARDEMLLFGEVTNAAGRQVAKRMRTPEGYTLTSLSSLLAVDRLLRTDLAPGAYTPSMAFGADFVMQIEGVRVVPVE